ncbi:transcription/translation regulatory transformer protein RfaH [Rheinheimera sp.]|uniref:transcription/translation regulatory transformer protein RfaH n=1 Tax=Rheinheimera sp. TaxID=1869214 RepID=UPI002735005B|nr:transcription/translation regulatory transformer protein RfaH [Rheinheimera sp.]MDP2715667.1 transcription/translation regulatory transformer protein RfaH [Rheinheimera sp.]
MNSADNQWYLLYCKPRQELRAQQQLANQGYNSFLPQISLQKLRGNKWQQVTEPLFPRYLFLYLPPGQELNISVIRSTRGISDFVRFGAQLARVPSELIQLLTEQQIALKQHPKDNRLKKGDEVSIINGPFSGLQALFDTAEGNKRSIVLISMLGQWVEAVVDNKQIMAKKNANT